MPPPRTVLVGFMGGAEQGKSTLGSKLVEAAGTSQEVMRETSDHIFELTRLALAWLDCERQQLDLENPSSVNLALAQVSGWFTDAGCNLFDIPADAFDPSRAPLDAEDVQLLAKAMADFQLNPTPYAANITVDNKALFRPLMTALQGIVSHMAMPWLRRHGYPDASNLWPIIAMEELACVERSSPGLPLLICSGLRLLGDDTLLRARSGYLLERRRFDTPDCNSAGLRTEVVRLSPDYVITGDCSLDELSRFAMWLWYKVTDQDGFAVGEGRKVLLDIGQILARA